ncbi:uncharacterized protein LOC119101164 [Pollicipes pollicipes]|uniref:uncharacterized protein LOC119101164 n=1 Tax=Pollicipes pollicipes TaxID=41117 RepID=UPI0018857011|nr:uncharacterized protein LOC119101164 [Pollicipes pollicipes]
MKLVQIHVVALACLCVASAYVPKKLIKKYAMMKMAESCFGEQVMDSFKEEMSAACEKCRADDPAGQPELMAQFDAIVGAGESRRKRSSHHGFTPEKLQKIRARISSMIGNVTCVMKELKFVDAENQIDLPSMKERIADMNLTKSLREDLEEGLDKCNDFAKCLPSSLVDQSPVTPGFGRQMAFFKCIKMAKVEACMKQDFREEYLPMLMDEGLEIDEDEAFQTIALSFVQGRGYF